MKKADLVLFIGQSNMAGRGEPTTRLESNAGLEYRAISSPNRLYYIEEPFGVKENNPDGIYDVFDNKINAKTGSLVTSFCNAYYKITHTTIVGVSASKGGSSISEWQIDSPKGYLKDAIERLTAAKEYLQNNDYDIQHTFALWCQGETDGDLGTTKEEYVNMFGSMWSELHKVIPNMFIIKIGECNIEGSYRRYDEIRIAQDIILNTYENIYLASDAFFGLREKGLMKDAFHYKQVGYDLCGTDAGTKVAQILSIEIKPVAEYRARYNIYALFKGEERKFADIVRKGFEENSIDAYIVMINPGSCHKKSDDNPLKDSAFYQDFDMVEAISDPAQKCVMSLMDACEMNKIRILNLFDYVNGNLERALARKGVSIFDVRRVEERKKYMPTDAVCIAAWGLNPDLYEYKKQAYQCIGEDRIIGYPANEELYEYYYIKPLVKDKQIEVIKRLAEKYLEYKAKNK